MKSKIIRDLTWDAIVAIVLSQAILFGAKWASFEYLKKTDELRIFMKEYYLITAIVMGLLFALYFLLNGFLCMRRYREVVERYGISDQSLYESYKEAYKCCQYRVYGSLVFINTSRGIICMDKSDIRDVNRRRVRHTRTVHRTVHGNVRYRERTNQYYTYHFTLSTRYGTFKNTVSNEEVLEDLVRLFY